eukprot:3029150-Prorocentrum_lima.AAC.1
MARPDGGILAVQALDVARTGHLLGEARIRPLPTSVHAKVQHRIEWLVQHQELLIPEQDAELLLPEAQLLRGHVDRFLSISHHVIREEPNLSEAAHRAG